MDTVRRLPAGKHRRPGARPPSRPVCTWVPGRGGICGAGTWVEGTQVPNKKCRKCQRSRCVDAFQPERQLRVTSRAWSGAGGYVSLVPSLTCEDAPECGLSQAAGRGAGGGSGSLLLPLAAIPRGRPHRRPRGPLNTPEGLVYTTCWEGKARGEGWAWRALLAAPSEAERTPFLPRVSPAPQQDICVTSRVRARGAHVSPTGQGTQREGARGSGDRMEPGAAPSSR